MSDSVLIALIALAGVIITVLGAILPIFINRWFKKVDDKLVKLHTEINGRMSELLELTKKISKQEGRDEQKEEDKFSLADKPIEVEVVNKEPIVVKIPTDK